MSKYFPYFCSIILLVISTASAEENSRWKSTVDLLKAKDELILFLNKQETIFSDLNVTFQAKMQESDIIIKKEVEQIFDTLSQKAFTSTKKINEEEKKIFKSNFQIANIDMSECHNIKLKITKDSFNKLENCRTCLFHGTSDFTLEVKKTNEKFLLFLEKLEPMKTKIENCVENDIDRTPKSEEIQCIEEMSRNVARLKMFDIQNLSLGVNKETLKTSDISEKLHKCQNCFENQYFSSLIEKFSNCTKFADNHNEQKKKEFRK